MLAAGGRTFRWGDRTLVMGIINATPDSFSGDGILGHPELAARLARQFEAAGADMLDLGGESSRPGASPLGPEEELARVLPALAAIRDASTLPVSIDTYHASVARAAISEGATIVNDIHGMQSDPDMAGVIADTGAVIVAMHNQRGREFHDVIGDIRAGFEHSLCIARDAGIDDSRVILDPGFGFGWKQERNFEILRRLPELWDLGLPLLVGPSRKSSIGSLLRLPVDHRVEGTATAVALAIAGGADIVRVHDVAEMVRVARVADAVVRANWSDTPESQ
jgi:dihydropteroate synthase